MYQNSYDNRSSKPGFRDKMKQKMSQLGDKIKETNFGLGNIKGLVQGYDNIDDNKKAGFHGFQSGGGGMNSGNHGLPPGSSFMGGSKGGGFGSGAPPTAGSWAGSSGNIGFMNNHSSPYTSSSSRPPHRKKKKNKTRSTEIVVSSTSESESTNEEDSEEDSSSEDEEARLAREKEERKQARRERKRAEAAAAAAEDAEAAAKAERRRMRKEKKEKEAAAASAEAAAKQQRREARKAKKEAKQREQQKTSSPGILSRGSTVIYKNKEQVTVIGVHTEDPEEPYYTILTGKGREKQTTSAYLSPVGGASLSEPASPGSMTGSCNESDQGAVGRTDSHDVLGHCNDLPSLKATLRAIRESLGQEWVTTMYQRFEESTGSNSNSLDLECFGKYLELFGIPQSRYSMYFDGFDRDGNGIIDLREFLLGMALLGESSLAIYSPEMLEERACTLFRIYDQNKDGTLDFEELLEMVSHLHQATGDCVDQDGITAEAHEILQVLPTGTLTHGITLNAFIRAVQSKDLFKSTTALLKQGIPQQPEETMAQMAEEFADILVNSEPSSPVAGASTIGAPVDHSHLLGVFVSPQPSSPPGQPPVEESFESPASKLSEGGSKMDLSAFFSPPDDDDSSSDEE